MLIIITTKQKKSRKQKFAKALIRHERAKFAQGLIDHEKRKFANALLDHEHAITEIKGMHLTMNKYRKAYPVGTKLDHFVVISEPFIQKFLNCPAIRIKNTVSKEEVDLALPFDKSHFVEIEIPTSLVLNNEGKWVYVYSSTPNTQFSYAR